VSGRFEAGTEPRHYGLKRMNQVDYGVAPASIWRPSWLLHSAYEAE
jgi:hypothetical protein